MGFEQSSAPGRGSTPPEIVLGEELLGEVGLATLAADESSRLLERCYDRLEAHVGRRLWRTGPRRLERHGIIDLEAATADATYEQLCRTCPLVHLVVWEEHLSLVGALRRNAPAILLIEAAFRGDERSQALADGMSDPSPFITDAM